MLNRRPGGPAFYWVLAFSTTACLQLLWSLNSLTPVFTELYNSSIAHSISLKWHVWSSSNGNNCHAVHRTLSSCASVYDCTMGFYLVSYCQPSLPTRFLPIGMCHFCRLWNGMFCRVEGQYTIHTEKSPGDLRRLAVPETPAENHRQTPVWKTLKRVK